MSRKAAEFWKFARATDETRGRKEAKASRVPAVGRGVKNGPQISRWMLILTFQQQTQNPVLTLCICMPSPCGESGNKKSCHVMLCMQSWGCACGTIPCSGTVPCINACCLSEVFVYPRYVVHDRVSKIEALILSGLPGHRRLSHRCCARLRSRPFYLPHQPEDRFCFRLPVGSACAA